MTTATLKRVTKIYRGSPGDQLPFVDAKALGEGLVIARVSHFSNVDLQGDRIVPGAFTKSIARYRAANRPIPIVWSHNWQDPFAHIGEADPAKAYEDANGLVLEMKFDIHKPFAAQVYDLVQARRVQEWSFAYDVVDERPGKDQANELVTLDIIEAGPTLKGANPATQTIVVKNAPEPDADIAQELASAVSDMIRKGASDEMINDFIAAFAVHGKRAPVVPARTTPPKEETTAKFMARMRRENPTAATALEESETDFLARLAKQHPAAQAEIARVEEKAAARARAEKRWREARAELDRYIATLQKTIVRVDPRMHIVEEVAISDPSWPRVADATSDEYVYQP